MANVTLVRVSRLPRIPLWAVAVVVAWGGLVVVFEWLKPAGSDLTLCWLRALTGVPCPTCGATRAVMAAGEGRWQTAGRESPLLVAAAITGLTWAVLRLGFGRAVRFERRSRLVMWTVVGGAVAANWIYLVIRHPE